MDAGRSLELLAHDAGGERKIFALALDAQDAVELFESEAGERIVLVREDRESPRRAVDIVGAARDRQTAGACP